MTPQERLDALAARGVQVYLGEHRDLRARCEPELAPVLAAALPAIRQHKDAIVEHLLAATAALAGSALRRPIGDTNVETS